MKKNLLIGLVTLGAASLLCGFDSAETVESLSQKMNEAVAAAEGATVSAALNVDAGVHVSDGTTSSELPIVVNGSLDLSASTKPPINMEMNLTGNVSAVGNGQEITIRLYAVPDESGNSKLYSYISDSASAQGEWTVETADSTQQTLAFSDSFIKAQKFSDLAEWGIDFELAPEAADVDGTECYLLSAVIDSSSIGTLIQKGSEISGQDVPSDDELSGVLGMMAGLNMKFEYYIDAATYLPVKIHVDLNDSDFSALSALISSSLGISSADSASASTAELIVNDISFDIVSTYGDAPEITVPQEALDAEAASTTES